MKKLPLALILGAALGTAMTLPGPAQAMPASSQLGTAAAVLNTVEQAQFIWGGRNYCFYLDGWHGPGFYWCGYAFRRGLGWGGPEGWRGWNRGGVGVGVHVGGHGHGGGHVGGHVSHAGGHGHGGGHGHSGGGHGGHKH